MRLKITFNVKNGLKLPINNNHIIQSFIYKYLRKTTDYQDWHNQAYELKGKSYRLFTFSSLYSKKFKMEDFQGSKSIIFNNPISFFISSPDPAFITQLKDVLEKERLTFDDQTGKQIFLDKKLKIIPEHFECLQNQDLTTVKIRMISPVTIHNTNSDGTTDYISPLELTIFNEAINKNLQNKYYSYKQQHLESFVQVKPLSDCKIKKVVTRYKNYFYITGWKGDFSISGSKEAIQFLYQAGLGDKNSLGFGMFYFI